jgi:transglutaminase/protease-like cytokinesis protein 3
MRKYLTLQLVLIFLAIDLFSQIDVKSFDYSKADSIALNFPKGKYKSYVDVSFYLTHDLDSEHEKFRAIFRWITDNIQYSFSNRTSDPNKVIKKGKAVCAGYSALLEAMCKSIGLKCITINGYSKTAVSDINKDLNRTDHAWNAIDLYGKWYLVDATWAWGYRNSKTRKFIKQYDNYYYLTEPQYFYKTHLPAEKKSFLSEKTIKKNDFIKSPIFYDGIIANELKSISPKKGIIKIRLKDSLEIKIQTEKNIENFSIQLKNNKNYFIPSISQRDGYYILTQRFERSGSYVLTIFANGKALATYKLIIK